MFFIVNLIVEKFIKGFNTQIKNLFAWLSQEPEGKLIGFLRFNIGSGWSPDFERGKRTG